jgi:cell division protein FtsB
MANIDNASLEDSLQELIGELKAVMEARADRVKELQAEIDEIEKSNAELEDRISEMLKGF